MGLCENYIDDIDEAYAASRWWFDLGWNNEQWLITHTTSSFNQTWRDNVIQSIARLYSSVNYLIYGNGDRTEPYRIPYYLRNCVGGGEEYELTMDKMLEAMWDGDLLRWFHFVTYIDSMRAGIWNLEIYDTHLADLYRHFSI